MEYKDFMDALNGGTMDIPTERQRETLIHGDDTVHLTVGVGYILQNGETIARDIIPQGEYLIQGLKLLIERGAVRGDDYILCCYQKDSSLFCTLHATHSYLSDEDFDLSVKRT